MVLWREMTVKIGDRLLNFVVRPATGGGDKRRICPGAVLRGHKNDKEIKKYSRPNLQI